MKFTVESVELEFLEIQAGYFIAGTRLEDAVSRAESYRQKGVNVDDSWFMKEVPQHSVYIDSFYILKTVIPEKLKNIFLGRKSNLGSENFPAVFESYELVSRFCKWLSARTKENIEIPTEMEWEKAARGIDAREFPWGNDFIQKFCNTKSLAYGKLVEIGKFSENVSPYGCIQMAGNIEEWTSSIYEPYPGGEEVLDNFSQNNPNRIIRGGKYSSSEDLARCARRHGINKKSVIGLRPIIRKPINDSA